MPQSLVKNYLHITFSTKQRFPFIDDLIREELHAYIGGICKNMECYPVLINSFHDHIHILCTLSKKIALMKLIEEIKSHSSKWIKTKDEKYQKFYWQNGYAAFSIGERNLETIKEYITNQKIHHEKKKFQDEYREFLREHNMDFNEMYVWD